MRKLLCLQIFVLFASFAFTQQFAYAEEHQASFCVKAGNVYSDPDLKEYSGSFSEGAEVTAVETIGSAVMIRHALTGESGWTGLYNLCSVQEFGRRKAAGEVPIQIINVGQDFLGLYFYHDFKSNILKTNPANGLAFWIDKSAVGNEVKLGSKTIVGDGRQIFLLKNNTVVELPLWTAGQAQEKDSDSESKWRKKIASAALLSFMIDQISEADEENLKNANNSGADAIETVMEKENTQVAQPRRTNAALMRAIALDNEKAVDAAFDRALNSARDDETASFIAADYLYMISMFGTEKTAGGLCGNMLKPKVEKSILKIFNAKEVVFILSDCYVQRAAEFEKNDQCGPAISDYSKALKLNASIEAIFFKEVAEAINDRNIEAVSSLAWMFATCPDPNFRNGSKALSFAEKALSLSESAKSSDIPRLHDVMAAAYAEEWKLKGAVEMQKMAVLLAEKKNRKNNFPDNEKKLAFYRQRLLAYENNTRWRGAAFSGKTRNPWDQIKTGLKLADAAQLDQAIPYLRSGLDGCEEERRSSKYQAHPLLIQVLDALPELIKHIEASHQHEDQFYSENPKDSCSIIEIQTKMLLSFVETAEAEGRSRAKSDMEFVLVKGGSFEMGNSFDDGDEDEKPVHRVKVSDFYISKYEITQAQWKRIMGHNPSHFRGDDKPVESVSWDDINVFIQKLNYGSRYSYRLPTEAEWEYAARFGGRKVKWSGNFQNTDILGEYAWFNENSDGQTHEVGLKKPNGFGLYDMSGNVSEWVSDWYQKDYYQTSPAENPSGPASGTERVIRGGSYEGSPKAIGILHRSSLIIPDFRFDDLGFRLVREELGEGVDFLGGIK